jgi:hypothetical protein
MINGCGFKERNLRRKVLVGMNGQFRQELCNVGCGATLHDALVL